MKAIAYVREIKLSRTGDVVHRSSQIERINRFAAENGIEIVAWLTDEAREESLLKRPGVQSILAYDRPYDIVICERVWTLSRSRAALDPFLKELACRGKGFECAASMWDCVSQQCRRRSRSLPVLPRFHPAGEAGGFRRYRVTRPVRLNFVHLVNPVPPSISRRL